MINEDLVITPRLTIICHVDHTIQGDTVEA